MIRVAAALVVAALAGCGGQAEGGDSASVQIDQHFDLDRGTTYVEGSLSYFRLEGPTTIEQQLTDDGAELELDPGRYVLRSWQRPCDGNCDFLDAPTDRCSAAFEASAGARLRAEIVVRPSAGCVIEVR